jgi:hypothetical protein
MTHESLVYRLLSISAALVIRIQVVPCEIALVLARNRVGGELGGVNLLGCVKVKQGLASANWSVLWNLTT